MRCARRSSAATRAALQALVGELHEADTGDLIEALDAGPAAALRRTAGQRLRLHRADRGRRRGPRGNPRRTAAEDRRRGRARPRFRRCGLHSRGPAEAGAGRNPRAAAAARARRARAQPALSGRIRRPADADRIHRGAADLDRRPRHRLHARDRRSAGPLLRALRGRRRPQAARRGRARPAAAHQAAGADRRSDGRRPPPRARRPRTRKRWRACSSATTWSRRRWWTTASGWSASSPSTTSSTSSRRRPKRTSRRSAASARDEELSDSVWTIARGRFHWLLVNLGTAFLASSVLGLVRGLDSQKMVALAVLVPIVASRAATPRTQTMTVAVRALATRELSDANALARDRAANCWSACSTGSPLPSSPASSPVAWFQVAGSRHRHRARHDLQCWRRRRSAASSSRWG